MKALVKSRPLLAGVAIVFLALSCNVLQAQGLESRPATEGRQLASENRPVSNQVEIVNVSGPIDLHLKHGATSSMIVHAEQRLLPSLVTAQTGNTLNIEIKGLMVNTRHPLKVELTLPALSQLQVRGSGDSQVNGFKGDTLELALTGSGNVNFTGQYRDVKASVTGSGDLALNAGTSESAELSLLGSGGMNVEGSSKTLKASLLGSGDLNARKFIAESVNINLLGSGDASVHATSSVVANIKGSGDISISGNPPKRSTSARGSGSVHWR